MGRKKEERKRKDCLNCPLYTHVHPTRGFSLLQVSTSNFILILPRGRILRGEIQFRNFRSTSLPVKSEKRMVEFDGGRPNLRRRARRKILETK